MRWLVLAVMTGCNWAFGLQSTKITDAAFFDAPLDAQVLCPTDGAPVFGPQLFELPTPLCEQYTMSEVGTATARCKPSSASGTSIASGPADGQLGLITSPSKLADKFADEPRLSPEGDLLVIRFPDINNVPGLFAFRLDPNDHTWSELGQLSYPSSFNAHATTPSRGPARHLVIADADTTTPALLPTLFELVGDGITWQVHDHYPLADLGLDGAQALTMTPDGLELALFGVPTGSPGSVLYAHRDTLDARFGPAQVVSTVPLDTPATPYMTQDCTRVYFSALSTVFYRKQ